ncbi:YggS family pyridoxal phosphate-dependent enzyme [Elioraea rosea]|uniref:YggS family pyridoxal phosphate-dependent enzyme n=1 Tax=Elioraea rosea TaxID=2492390 RepID=UPI0019512E27|nr:YggS family pyridoxal phosphate-dependent enzyme [Elioraea rosea]
MTVQAQTALDATDPDTIATRLEAVRARIAAAERAAGRAAGSVTLVAVSKTHGAEAVQEALAAGQAVFGENRVQEAAAKFPALRAAHPALRLHIIGPLQTNKVREAMAIADVIETLDRPRLAQAIAAERARARRCPDLLVQVNTGREPQKAGIDPDAAEAFVAECRDALGLPVAGLMCIPPVEDDPRPHFDLLAAMAGRLGLGVVSMGMSGDFETAIAHGATHVRVGSAIFGARPPLTRA